MENNHAERSHAKLSASSSARWLACPPSALLNAQVADTASDFAREGTCAHELAEYKVNKFLGHNVRDPTENLDFFDAEMAECTDSYLQYITEETTKYHNPVVMVEQRLDFSAYVPDGFGTGDCIIITDEVLTVIDFKYGKNVLVSAENNSQMMLYALGALDMFGILYDIKEIRMVIFQPRMENISEYTISVEKLLEWAENTLIPTAKLAAEGKGEFQVGEHCRFCKVKATCRERAEYNLMLAQYDFAMPAELEDTEIETILPKADSLVSWVNDIKEYALSQAIAGKQWTGWKLVEGRSVRKYTDENAVAEKVKSAGADPYEHKVLGLTAMQKLLGKTKFNELLGGLIYKPQGKPTLVPDSDKRPEWNSAENDFKEES
ncbi:MAG: DUF2800 domain-containing protein [Oscillospiraceae bacterium]|nr:DUF2800 domain-containing protein [Oscillospiraceae bacterium]